jgi:hypothetical protein
LHSTPSSLLPLSKHGPFLLLLPLLRVSPPPKISSSDTHRQSVSSPPLSLTLSLSLVRCCCSLVCYFLLLKA